MPNFHDNDFTVLNDADTTKGVKLDPSATTAVRSLKIPDADVDLASIPAANVTGVAMTLASTDIITGKKTFPSDDAHSPVFTGESIGPSAAFHIVDEAGGTPHIMGVVGNTGSSNGQTCILNPGSMVSTGETGTLAALATGLLKNTTQTGTLSIANAADFEAEGLTIDATRTWTTKQTFPGDAYAPEMGKIELGHATDTTLTREGAGDILVEGNHVYRAGGTDVAISDGGTGASTLTAAGLPYHVGTDVNQTGRTDDGTYTLLSGPHAAGWYEFMCEVSCTTAGSSVARVYVNLSSGDGGNAGDAAIYTTIPFIGISGSSAATTFANLSIDKTDLPYYGVSHGVMKFYTDGGQNGGFDTYINTVVGHGTGSPAQPVFNLRARLMYLGA